MFVDRHKPPYKVAGAVFLVITTVAAGFLYLQFRIWSAALPTCCRRRSCSSITAPRCLHDPELQRPGCWQDVSRDLYPAPYLVMDTGASIAPYNHLELGQPLSIEYVWGRQVGELTINP